MDETRGSSASGVRAPGEACRGERDAMGHIDASPETGRKWPEPEVTEVIRGVLLCPSRSSLCSPILSGANLRQAGRLIRNCGSATAYSAFRGHAGGNSRVTVVHRTQLRPAP